MKTSTPQHRTGTQSIERAVYLLRELAARGVRGWGLGGLAAHCELDEATVHRILKCLIAEGLVEQRASDKRYLLGAMNYEMGMSVPHRRSLTDASRRAVSQLARQIPRVTASVVVRSGDDCVCIARAGAPSFISKSSAMPVGARAPLLSRISGMLIVAALPQEAAQAIVERNRRRMAHFGDTFIRNAEDIVHASRGRSYAISAGLFLYQVNSIAVHFGPENAPVGALAISARCDDYAVSALKALRPKLEATAAALAEQAPAP